jgi:hypothetical protein
MPTLKWPVTSGIAITAPRAAAMRRCISWFDFHKREERLNRSGADFDELAFEVLNKDVVQDSGSRLSDASPAFLLSWNLGQSEAVICIELLTAILKALRCLISADF